MHRKLDELSASVGGRSFARVQVANTFRSRCVGLLNRSSLEPITGLLFDPGGSIHTLWMRFPIDVVFLDESFTVLRIASRLQPWRFVFAPHRTRYVLELAAGAARSAGLGCGTVLQMCRQEPTVPDAASAQHPSSSQM